MRALLLVVTLFLGMERPAQLPPFDAATASVSQPATVTVLDMGKLKGSPAGLAWSEDGSQLYVRTAEYDRWRNERARHYLLPSAGGTPVPVDVVPGWASTYWIWKSGMVAPGSPDVRLETETLQRMATAVGSVRDAGASQSRADPSRSQVETDMASAQHVTTTTVKMRGQLLMQLDNEPFVPGMRYGWGPAGTGGLAYADARNRLVLIDRTGKKLEVAGADDVLLPAWSPDGRRVAYLQRQGKKKYGVLVATVEAR